jgi:hypothetical protein
MGELENMINCGEIESYQYFLMHPFSVSEKMAYKLALKDVDYYKSFYVISNKTYERLATICNVIHNTQKNLTIITGYRGCGKTNFLHLVKDLASGEISLETMENIYRANLADAGSNSDLKRSVREEYSNTIKHIRATLFSEYYGKGDSIVCKEIAPFITAQIRGTCKYINFDEGGMGRQKPFSMKLFSFLRDDLDQHITNGTLGIVIDKVTSFVSRNRRIIEDNFEYIDFSTLKTFWKSVHTDFSQLKGDELLESLEKHIEILSLEQLLFVYTILEYAEILTLQCDSAEKKLIYMLDNIDIIADGISDIFQNTMMGIWNFIWDTRNVFTKLDEKGEASDKEFIELYSKTKIIVAMRETTAMHISEHWRGVMRSLLEHFDMSTDVDKTQIMQRKIDFGKELIQSKKVSSKSFIAEMNCYNQLAMDKPLMKNLFLLYNNDYRTAMTCITTICKENLETVKIALNLIEHGEVDFLFGGRGIIYRLILESFFSWNYFDLIGIPSRRKSTKSFLSRSNYGYSCARIILTILCNQQAKITERFFVNPEESVPLDDLYNMIQDLIDLDDFVHIIDGMYSLRNRKFWNHLVTFDNILLYIPESVKNYLTAPPETDGVNHNKIYIRATSAGQMFVDNLCIHFEYFSSRYASPKSASLFLYNNLRNNEHIRTAQQIIEDVYAAVEQCCGTLEEYNQNVLKSRNQSHYKAIIKSPYYYEAQFHEERVIHNHISYLEAYRNYLLHMNGESTNMWKMNTFLIEMIKKYLNLLKYDLNTGIREYRNLFYSDNSRKLYNELMVCIEKVEMSPILSNGIEITRDYYMLHFDKTLCSYFRATGIKYE